MQRPTIRRAILGGFVATVAMTIVMYAGPAMGMPKMDIAAMLGSLLGGNWWLGMTLHFLNGSIFFPLLYAYVLFSVLPGAAWLKGVQWGLILWFLAQGMVMPMMGMGFFSAGAPAPFPAVAGSFIGHSIYGAILGAIACACDETRAAILGVGEQEIRPAGWKKAS